MKTTASPVVAGCRGQRSVVVLIWLCVVPCGTISLEECLGLFETYDQGIYVCRSHPDLVTALQIAETLGRRECQEAFQMERWNCSGFSILKTPNITNRVTKEAAYVHALSLAAIAHSVAKVCALGDATSCSCEGELLDLPQRGSNTEYEVGCSDNVLFGVEFAKQFLQRRYLGIGFKENIEVHNMDVGANVVQKHAAGTTKACKCIGISGSCILKSCQYKFPEFAILGKDILSIYRNHTCHISELLQYTQDDRIVLTDPPDVRLSAMQEVCSQENESRYLLFVHNSPDYCVQNDVVGSVGTAGRMCNPHSTRPNSCDYLCGQCGRNHSNVLLVYNEICFCEFKYCCDIKCHKCPRAREICVCA